MLRDEILEMLRSDQKALDSFCVKSIGVFGSIARGEAVPDSDVDILVEFSVTPDLFEFIDLKFHLESLMGREVDLATPDALHPMLKDDIMKDVVYA